MNNKSGEFFLRFFIRGSNMYNKSFFLGILLFSPYVYSGLITIDTIKAIVSSKEGTKIVTQSDIYRPTLSGESQTLDNILFEKAVMLDAKKHQIVAGDDAVESYLEQIMSDNHLTPSQVRELFRSGGYTYDEGLKQLRDMQTINSMMQFKVSSELIIPRREVEQYYQDNPFYDEASYTVRRTLVPFAKDMTKEEQKEILQDRTARRKSERFIWGDSFTVQENDLAEEKKFITKISVSDVSEPQAVSGGFELFQLISKKESRLLSLDERYVEIVQILQQPKYVDVMNKYREELFNSVSVIKF